MITLQIDGKPIPWKRVGNRVVQGQVYSYDKQKQEKQKVLWQLRPQYSDEPFLVPLKLDITFYMPIPKATSSKKRQQMLTDFIKPMKRPDLDNLEKFYLDCLTGFLFHDDAQITDLHASKVYSLTPSVLIRVTPFINNTAPVTDHEGIEDEFYSLEELENPQTKE